MKFITRNQQVEETLPETYVKYPHLIPYLQKVEHEKSKHMYPFEVLEYFTKTQKDITKSAYDQVINRTVRLFHYILSRSYNVLLKSNSRAGVNYLMFTDTRMGGISMDFASAATNPLLAKYSISTKHRLDLDMVVKNLHNPEVVAHIILSYCNSIIEYAKLNHITNDFVFYNDATSAYCKVGLDKVEESKYNQVVLYLENYWTKIPTKTGLDILAKTAAISGNVNIYHIDYVKDTL